MAAREWTRKIEDPYNTHANDAQLLAEGTVKACGPISQGCKTAGTDPERDAEYLHLELHAA
jgi:hypothetical protein